MKAESDIAELKSKKAFEMQQLQIEEAEGLIRASSICHSLISRTLEDNNSEIESWFDQGVEDFNKCFSQPKQCSRVENEGESSEPSLNFQRFDHKNLQSRSASKSPQRKNTGITFPKTNALLQQGNEKPKPKYEFAKPSFKIGSEFLSFRPAVPVQ